MGRPRTLGPHHRKLEPIKPPRCRVPIPAAQRPTAALAPPPLSPSRTGFQPVSPFSSLLPLPKFTRNKSPKINCSTSSRRARIGSSSSNPRPAPVSTNTPAHDASHPPSESTAPPMHPLAPTGRRPVATGEAQRNPWKPTPTPTPRPEGAKECASHPEPECPYSPRSGPLRLSPLPLYPLVGRASSPSLPSPPYSPSPSSPATNPPKSTAPPLPAAPASDHPPPTPARPPSPQTPPPTTHPNPPPNPRPRPCPPRPNGAKACSHG